MAGARLRLKSSTQAIIVLPLLLLLLPPLHDARLAGDEPRMLTGVMPEAPSTGREEGEGHRIAPAKTARPLRILAEPVPARRRANHGMGDMELPSPHDTARHGEARELHQLSRLIVEYAGLLHTSKSGRNHAGIRLAYGRL
ncbi:hypothetical protein ACP70R_029821 [Stipagrostis hirtigluma subsp. patula]